jgi:hypothetical protein
MQGIQSKIVPIAICLACFSARFVGSVDPVKYRLPNALLSLRGGTGSDSVPSDERDQGPWARPPGASPFSTMYDNKMHECYEKLGPVKSVEDMLNGPITLDQVQTLQEMGVIKSGWTVESEEECSSDLREAEYAKEDWPEDWVGSSSQFFCLWLLFFTPLEKAAQNASADCSPLLCRAGLKKMML